MTNDTGLPDYIADHFAYLVRSSRLARIGQVVFFVSSVVLPLSFAASFPFLAAAPPLGLVAMLGMLGVVFVASLTWYLLWTDSRKETFRRERPASYERWFGPRRRGPFGGFSLRNRLRLARMEMRYLLLSKEPSAKETFALTMLFVRSSL